MKKLACILTIITIIGCFFCPAMTVYATRDVPDNVYGQGQGDGGSSEITPDDVEDIFGVNDDFGKDETGYSDVGVSWVKKFINIGVKFLIRIFPSVFAVTIIVDGLMIFHPFFAHFFANVCPIRLYSKECESYTGYHYTARKNDNGSSGGDSGGPGGESDSGGSGKKSFKKYFYQRSKIVILCTSWVFLAYSGILGALLYKVVAMFSSVAASWIA